MDTDCQICKINIIKSNPKTCEVTLVKIKDAIIGSNRQKSILIDRGFIPIIVDLGCDITASWHIRVNAFIIIDYPQQWICTVEDENRSKLSFFLTVLSTIQYKSSLAKGSEDQLKILVSNYKIIDVLIKQIFLQNNDQKIIELCLSTLSTIFESLHTTIQEFDFDIHSMSYLLSLSSPESSIQTQISVASLLVSLCQSFKDQVLIFQAGTIPILARMMCSNCEHLQLPAIRSLASLCYANRAISDNVCVTSFRGKSLPDILAIMTSRLYSGEIQLTAARCITYIYRSGTLPSSDYRLVYKALPCLARLCTDDYTQFTRASAAQTLAYLIEMDSDLQRIAAINNNLMKHLAQLFQYDLPILKKASFRCFGSLAANDENIRKKVIETSGFKETLIESLCDTDYEVRLASFRCLHSLSRSVYQLRTTFQDSYVWKTLMTAISTDVSNEMLIVITSVMCNLLLEFSPSKEPLINSGIIEILCGLTEHNDAALRLNAIWAIMNMAFQSNQQVKTKIINTIRTDRILKLLSDDDSKIVMKTLGLLRNLLSKSLHIDNIMSLHSAEVMKAVNLVLESDNSSEIKEQALCIVANIAAGAQERDYIMDDEFIMQRLSEFLFHQDSKLQSGALFAISNIVHRKDSWSKERYIRLIKFEIIQSLLELNKKVNTGNVCYEDYIYRTLKQIVLECKNCCPNVMK